MKLLIALMMLVANVAATQDLSTKMLIFPQETNTAHVKLTPMRVGYSAVTVCHRSFTDLRRQHSLFSLATSNTYNNELVIYLTNDLNIVPHIRNIVIGFGGIDYPPNQWHSICTTWAASSGLVQVWLNGQPLMKKYITESPINDSPTIVLGQEQDSPGGGFAADQSFVGMMTDVHMWDYVLSPCEIQKYMKEQNFTPGNVLNWAALDFQITGRVLIENKQTGCDLDLS